MEKNLVEEKKEILLLVSTEVKEKDILLMLYKI